jgi:eukaryotic-like serine/threonine-protein kinase
VHAVDAPDFVDVEAIEQVQPEHAPAIAIERTERGGERLLERGAEPRTERADLRELLVDREVLERFVAAVVGALLAFERERRARRRNAHPTTERSASAVGRDLRRRVAMRHEHLHAELCGDLVAMGRETAHAADGGEGRLEVLAHEDVERVAVAVQARKRDAQIADVQRVDVDVVADPRDVRHERVLIDREIAALAGYTREQCTTSCRFHGAARYPPRYAFVTHVECLDDDTVLEVVRGSLPPARREAIRSHLDACPACRILVGAAARSLRDDVIATSLDGEQSTVPLGPAAVTSASAEWPVMSPGDLVDRYCLERPLGEGGHGVVWAAKHVLLHKHVALKFLKSADADHGRRFLREARIAATLRHPNLVEVFDILELPGGTLAMVMEQLTGESLGARLRRGKLSLAEIAHVFVPIVDALRAAHERGIVHRDLKPHNLFLASVPKVLDFGLAKLINIEAQLAEGSVMTRSGLIVGTPQYMAPEQFLGDRSIDERADVWSLGVILFECVTGTRAFDCSGFGPLFHAVTVAPLPSVRERAPSGTPEPLIAIIEAMLSRDRVTRPPLEDLQNVLAGLS